MNKLYSKFFFVEWMYYSYIFVSIFLGILIIINDFMKFINTRTVFETIMAILIVGAFWLILFILYAFFHVTIGLGPFYIIFLMIMIMVASLILSFLFTLNINNRRIFSQEQDPSV
ncbi:MAG: hypothetical protein ACW981_13155 [Candidatus Hodarchaeales archaeon]|jgi:hypothetical protein